MNDKIESLAMPADKSLGDKVALTIITGLVGLAVSACVEKGYFAGKSSFTTWRSNKTN